MNINSGFHFSKLDNVVKEAIRQFLPLETLSKSAATSKLFQKIMAEAWMKMAKKLEITPTSPDSAQAEVITRLMGNAAVAKYAFPEKEEIQKCQDPFQLNKLIKTALQTPWQPIRSFESLIDKYPGGLDPTFLKAVIFILKEGDLSEAPKATWERALFRHSTSKKNLLIFEAIIQAMMKSTRLTSDEKQELMENSMLPDMANYPYTEVLIRAGWRPSRSILNKFYFFEQDLSETHAFRSKYIKFLLTNATVSVKIQLLDKLRSSVPGTLEEAKQAIESGLESNVFNDNNGRLLQVSDKAYIAANLYEYIHSTETEAVILGTEPNLKDIPEKRSQILSLIEQEEKNSFDTLLKQTGQTRESNKPSATYIKNYYSLLRKAANL